MRDGELLELDSFYSIETSFIREIAEGINLSFRYYGEKGKEHLLRILQRKLGPEGMRKVLLMYFMCYEAEDIVRLVRPKSMDEIVQVVESFFHASEYLHEVTVGLRRCDLVFSLYGRYKRYRGQILPRQSIMRARSVKVLQEMS